MTTKRAFVAGATGLTGRALVRALHALGVDTTAHIRPDSSRRKDWEDTFRNSGIECSFAPWTPEGIDHAFAVAKPDLVFGCLGTTKRRAAAGGGDYQAVDYGLTALLIDGATRCTPQPLFIYLSSVGVTPNARTAYMKARADVEAHLKASGLSSLIVRPSFIIGRRDDARPGEAIGARLSDGALAALSCIGLRRVVEPYRTLSGDSLAQGMAVLAMDGVSGTEIVGVPEIKQAHRRYLDEV